MGKMSFLLPPGLPADLIAELLQSSLAGGLDNSPVPTATNLTDRRLDLSRSMDESGYWTTPWNVGDCCRLMLTTATLIERAEPYDAALELARGKLNQLRNALAGWFQSGSRFPDSMAAELARLNRLFAQALVEGSAARTAELAAQVLQDTSRLIEVLVPFQAEQILQRRRGSNTPLETTLGCQLWQVPELADEFVDTFNAVGVSFSWKDIEPVESQYNWETVDRLIDWANGQNLRVTGGPLIDFSGAGLPAWLALWEGDVPNLANFMCDYLETVINRYRGKIRRWLLTAGANLSDYLNLDEDETLFLTAKLAETAAHLAPNLELVIGVAQPWGEYLARDDYTYTPLVFLDQLLRAGIHLSAIELDLVSGVNPRGSYCRDLLEIARLVDQYASLGTPIQVVLGYPSTTRNDPQARSGSNLPAGFWPGGFTPESQADWAELVTTLALSRVSVAGVRWTHFSDAAPHQFANCGLIDGSGQVKPALVRLSRLRARYLG